MRVIDGDYLQPLARFHGSASSDRWDPQTVATATSLTFGPWFG